jgi:hypothetical protein
MSVRRCSLIHPNLFFVKPFKTNYMKKKFTLALSLLLMTGMVYDYNMRTVQSSSSGAPNGYTGDPAVNNGATCGSGGGCHGSQPGTPSGNESSMITSNIPQAGYVAGQTYDMTVSVSGGGNKFGFSLSAQGNAGSLIASSSTQLNGSGNFVTHTFSSNTGSGGRSWNFQWTAPTAGTGDVTFYATTLYAFNGGDGGDVAVPVSITVSEATGVGISEAALEALSVYPNPVIDEIHVAAKDVDEEIMFTMYSMDGKKVLEEKHDGGDITIDLSSKSLTTGVYFLQMEAAGSRTIKKLLVK